MRSFFPHKLHFGFRLGPVKLARCFIRITSNLLHNVRDFVVVVIPLVIHLIQKFSVVTLEGKQYDCQTRYG